MDDAAFAAATTAEPKFTTHADRASQWTAARKGPAFFACCDSYLIDTDHGIIMDVDASRSDKTAEAGAMRKMLDQTNERFGLKPDGIAADTAYRFSAKSPVICEFSVVLISPLKRMAGLTRRATVLAPSEHGLPTTAISSAMQNHHLQDVPHTTKKAAQCAAFFVF